MSRTSIEESAFERDTALVRGCTGELRGSLSEGWRAGSGPHGGYVSALMLRGLMMAIDDASRAPLT